MKIILITFLSVFIFVYNTLNDELAEILNNLNTDFLSRIDKSAQNINTETIQYGLSYDNTTVVKVFIKLVDEGIKNKVNFVAFLKNQNETKEYALNCSNPSNDLIVCFSEPGIQLNTSDKYFVYYNRSRNESIIFDYENLLEDDKRISLIFKPELYVNQTVYLDNKKIMAQINKKTVAEGYLYVINKLKKVLNKPKDGFNKYIELNNFIFHPEKNSFKKKNILDIYIEAFKRGYRMVDAEVQFTKDKIPIIYNQNKDIFSKTLEELQKNKKILTLDNFLKICKEKMKIIELKFSFCDLKEENPNLDEYSKILIKQIEENNMFDSLFLDVAIYQQFYSKLISLKNDISLSISNINNKEDVDQIRDKYKNAKRLIYSLNLEHINEDIVKYISSQGKKIKVSFVNNVELAEKLQSWGVNYLSTNNLPPFLIKNELDEPYIVKCVPIFLDDLSECKMGKEIVLRDNEKYNIHYSLNIYNKSEDINETALGEFRYEDTKINDNKYYIIKFINFKRGLIQLITSDIVEKGKQLNGVIGPKYDNVAESYQFEFYCDGINQHIINCEIEKDDDKIEFKGEYVIYYLQNYSYNEEEIEDWNLSKLKTKHIYSKQEKMMYTFLIILISIVFLFSSYSMQSQRDFNFSGGKKDSINKQPLKAFKKFNFLTDAEGNKLFVD